MPNYDIKSFYVIYTDTIAGVEWGWCDHEFWSEHNAVGSCAIIKQDPNVRKIEITDTTQVFVYEVIK